MIFLVARSLRVYYVGIHDQTPMVCVALRSQKPLQNIKTGALMMGLNQYIGLRSNNLLNKLNCAPMFAFNQFDAGINLPNDVILSGRKSGGKWHHIVEGRRSQGSTSVSVRRPSNNVYVAEVDFDRPFDYSTSTWAQGK